MRDQYAGDISDVIKFGLLRALTANDRRLGLAWYYAPGHDGKPDGRHVEWQSEKVWHSLDPDVALALSSLPERSVEALQNARLWPAGCLFHREPMPDKLRRTEWAIQKRKALEGCNIIFLDPDNGLGSDPEKHATFDEVRELRKPGRAIVFITFPKRIDHDQQVDQLHQDLRRETGAESVMTVRTHVSVPSVKNPKFFVPRIRWFTIVDGNADLLTRARIFATALNCVPLAGAKIS